MDIYNILETLILISQLICLFGGAGLLGWLFVGSLSTWGHNSPLQFVVRLVAGFIALCSFGAMMSLEIAAQTKKLVALHVNGAEAGMALLATFIFYCFAVGVDKFFAQKGGAK